MYLFLLVVLLTNTSLNSWSLSNTVNPLQQVWEWLHLFLGETSSLPSLDPRPCLHVGNRVLALSKSSEIFSLLTAVFTGEMNFKYTVDTEGFVLEARDSICDVSMTCLGRDYGTRV